MPAPNPAIDLGLAISGALLGPGERRKHREIAAFCGCSTTRIQQIEKSALKKIRKSLGRISQTGIRDELRNHIG